MKKEVFSTCDSGVAEYSHTKNPRLKPYLSIYKKLTNFRLWIKYKNKNNKTPRRCLMCWGSYIGQWSFRYSTRGQDIKHRKITFN